MNNPSITRGDAQRPLWARKKELVINENFHEADCQIGLQT